MFRLVGQPAQYDSIKIDLNILAILNRTVVFFPLAASAVMQLQKTD